MSPNLESKPIHAHVYDPAGPSLFKTSKNDHGEVHTIACTRSAECELYARGQCIERTFMAHCIYGRSWTTSGPTPRARGYREWLAGARERTKAIGRLESPPKKLVRVGDMLWLPYAHMKAAYEGETKMFGSHELFVPFDAFTADLIVRLCTARPRAIMGGEITPYQAESVPLFVAHLAEVFPALLAEAAGKSERVKALVAARSLVGRKAKLRSLRPNVGAFRTDPKRAPSWTWDGTHMTTTTRADFPPFTPFDATEVRIVPGPDAVVTITDDAQAGPDVVLVD